MKKTYTDVIKETAEFYGADPKGRRSISPAKDLQGNPGHCMYVGPGGRRCAFARCVAPGQEAELAMHEGSPARCALSGGCASEYAIRLAPEYEHLVTAYFWDELQTLHDTAGFWDLEKGGLSHAGQRYVDNQIRRWTGAEDRNHQADTRVPWTKYP